MTARAYAKVIRAPEGTNRMIRLAVVTCEPGQSHGLLGRPVVMPFEVGHGPIWDEAREHPTGEVWEVETDKLPLLEREWDRPPSLTPDHDDER